MREIKFRAWDAEARQMVLSSTMSAPIIGHELSDFAFCHGAYELMQFTGLTDKNGVEIYEGDIVSLPESKTLFECRYNRHRGEFAWFVGEHYIYPIGDMRKDADIAIAGNIHANPELLEGE